jgi:hypothetical protein
MKFKGTEIATVSVAALALIGSVTSAFYTYANRNRELNIELVKIGIGILRVDPKETQTTGAGAWAIDLIEKYSEQSFTPEARKQLLRNALPIVLQSGSPGACTIVAPGRPDICISGVTQQACTQTARQIGAVPRWHGGECPN